MHITTLSPTRRAATVLLGFGLAISTAVGGAAADNYEDDDHDDGPQGAIDIVTPDDLTFTQIAPFARFSSAKGDFTTGEHATLGVFGAGAASPPHTHSGSYYGVVLAGDMNNPFGTEASPPSLAPGSFWSVPGDEQHVTACLDPDGECTFFFHAADAFDFFVIDGLTEPRSAEASSVPVANLVFDDIEGYDGAATMWGDRATGPHGTILRIEAGEEADDLIHRHGFGLVPMTGSLTIESDDTEADLPVGSLVDAEANSEHELECEGDEDCLVYLFSDGPLDLVEDDD